MEGDYYRRTDQLRNDECPVLSAADRWAYGNPCNSHQLVGVLQMYVAVSLVSDLSGRWASASSAVSACVSLHHLQDWTQRASGLCELVLAADAGCATQWLQLSMPRHATCNVRMA
jgi:hypothetical protein